MAESRFVRRMKTGLRMIAAYPSRLFTKVAFSAKVVDSYVNKQAAIDKRTRFYRSSLGRCSYVGFDSWVESCDIGQFCSIASECFIGGAGHPLDNASTSPVFCTGGNITGVTLANYSYDPFVRTTIGNDVWIGFGSKVAAGVTIADGAVIGMGSVLTKDVGPYEIWAGNPAKLIRKRFSEETIDSLLSSKWWEWTDERILENSTLFEGKAEEIEEWKNL